MNSGILILTPLTLVSLGCLTRFSHRFHLVIADEKSILMLVRCCTRHFPYFSSVCEYMRFMVVNYICLCIAVLIVYTHTHIRMHAQSGIIYERTDVNLYICISVIYAMFCRCTHASSFPCFAHTLSLACASSSLAFSLRRVRLLLGF